MGPDSKPAPGRVLADGDVRYVGEPIAIVVAESRYVAEDAAELVEVDIEPVAPVLDMFAAIEDADQPRPPRARDQPLRGGRGRSAGAAGPPRRRAAHLHRDLPPAPLPLRADGDPRHRRLLGPVAGAPGDHRLLPERARDAAVLLPHAGHPRGRHPRHDGRRRRLLRPEDVHGRGGARGRHRRPVDRWPADQVDRGSRREPDQRRPLAPGVHHGHRRGRRRRSAARRQGAPRRGRRRLPAPRERA